MYILPEIYRYREWLKILYHSEIDLKWRKYLFDKYYCETRDYLKSNSNIVSPLSLEQTVKIVIDSVVSIISVWISEEIPTHPSKFFITFLQLMEYSPSSFL